MKNVLRMAPEFNEETLRTPQMLTKFGIWKEVKGWTELQSMPRYFPGRNILVKATVDPILASKTYC